MTLRLLIGADQALAFHRWRDARNLLRFAPPLVVLREPAASHDALMDGLRATGAWTGEELRLWEASCVAGLPLLPDRSTVLRDLLRQGGSLPEGWLDPKVLAYIRANGLYSK